MSIALFMSFAFLVPFAEDQGITSTAAAWLVAIIGAASVSGRLVLSGLTRRFGPLRLYQACVAVQPLAYVVWMVAGDSYGLLVLFAVILGVSYGGYVALAPTVAAAMFGVIGLGGVLGLLYLGGGLGGLVGPPVGGALGRLERPDRGHLRVARRHRRGRGGRPCASLPAQSRISRAPRSYVR